MAESNARKVLVVEDNELNMRLFCDLLEAYGYQTYQCRDGAKAVEIARRELPDLIIMDIQLPEVSGLDITRWLKDDDKVGHIPVLAVTAFAMRADEQRHGVGQTSLGFHADLPPSDLVTLHRRRNRACLAQADANQLVRCG